MDETNNIQGLSINEIANKLGLQPTEALNFAHRFFTISNINPLNIGLGLIYGAPGTGKTTAVVALAKYLFGQQVFYYLPDSKISTLNFFEELTLEKNTSLYKQTTLLQALNLKNTETTAIVFDDLQNSMHQAEMNAIIKNLYAGYYNGKNREYYFRNLRIILISNAITENKSQAYQSNFFLTPDIMDRIQFIKKVEFQVNEYIAIIKNALSEQLKAKINFKLLERVVQQLYKRIDTNKRLTFISPRCFIVLLKTLDYYENCDTKLFLEIIEETIIYHYKHEEQDEIRLILDNCFFVKDIIKS